MSTFDTAKAAVIGVDMRNDFGAKGGMFDWAGIGISGIQKAIAPTAKVLAAAREADVKVVYLKMGFCPDPSDVATPGSVNRVRYLGFLKVGERVMAPTAGRVESWSAIPGRRTFSPNSSRRPATISFTRRGSAASRVGPGRPA